MSGRPRLPVTSVTIGAPDPRELAAFYARLLGWTVWLSVAGSQHITQHLDIAVTDLDASVSWAIEQGAALAGYQPQNDVRVLLDPAGHPFCLYVG